MPSRCFRRRATRNARNRAALVVLSLEESADLDSTALESLGEYCSWLNGRGGELRLARLKDAARDALLRANLPRLSGPALDYSSVDDAVRDQRVRESPRAHGQ